MCLKNTDIEILIFCKYQKNAKWVGLPFINTLKTRMKFFYQIISDSLEEITVQIEGIKADDRLTFIEKN